MQWRIQDFPQGGAPTPKIAIIFQIFAKNCMKMKEFGPPGGRPWRPPWIRQWYGILIDPITLSYAFLLRLLLCSGHRLFFITSSIYDL